jgi:hypothetical protein
VRRRKLSLTLNDKFDDAASGEVDAHERELKRRYEEREIERETEKYTQKKGGRSKRPTERSPLAIAHSAAVAKDTHADTDDDDDYDDDDNNEPPSSSSSSSNGLKKTKTKAMHLKIARGATPVMSPEPRRPATQSKGLSWFKMAIQKEKEKTKTKALKTTSSPGATKRIKKESVSSPPGKRRTSPAVASPPVQAGVPSNLHKQLEAHELEQKEKDPTAAVTTTAAEPAKNAPSPAVVENEKEKSDGGEGVGVEWISSKDKSLTPPSVPPLALGVLRRSGGSLARSEDASGSRVSRASVDASNDITDSSIHQTGVVAINEKRAEAMRQLMHDLEAAASKRAHEAEEAAAEAARQKREEENAERERDEKQQKQLQERTESDKKQQLAQQQHAPYENDDDVGKINDSDRARIRSRPQSTELNLIVCRICEQVL